jgi:predicted Zn-dependent protease
LGVTKYSFVEASDASHRLGKTKILVSTKRLGVELPIEELYRVLFHEMGHAIGLMDHSPYPRDVMYFSITRNGPTEITDRDRRTL